MQWNQFDGKLYQFLLDVGKFGLGIIKTAWHKETQITTQNQEVPRESLFMPEGANHPPKVVQVEAEGDEKFPRDEGREY